LYRSRSIKNFQQLLLSSDSGVVAGFVLIVALMLVVSILGIMRMHSLKYELDTIIENHFQKGQLITSMRVAARERTLGLHKMINLGDPFDRDDEWMRFNANASVFAAARMELIALPLAADEAELLVEQGRYTGLTVPIQDEVVDLAQADKYQQAESLLIEKAIPMQNKVLAQLDMLSSTQQRATSVATARIKQQYNTTRQTMIVLTVLFVAISMIVAVLTVHRLRRDRRSIYSEKEKAQVTLHSIGDAVVTTDAQGRIETINGMADRLIGRKEAEVKGHLIKDVFTLLHDSTYKPAESLIMKALHDKAVINGSADLLLKSQSGKEYAIEATAAPIRDDDGNVFGGVLVFRDVTEMRALSRELGYQAKHDALTSLYNRREFEKRLATHLDMVRRDEAKHVLCYIDLDNFKIVNDTCGHAAGDALLKRLSKLLKTNIHKSDVLARLGGDEFGIIVVDSRMDDAKQTADKIRNAIKGFRFYWEGDVFEIGASIGLVEIGKEVRTIYDLLRAADFACYAAKEMGRNQIQIYSPDDLTMVRRKGEMEWVQRINYALEQGLFCLYCQEIVPLASASRSKYEFLLRMKTANGDVVPPSVFLPAAERYQQISVIDRWVIKYAFEVIASLTLEQLHNIDCFNINLSGQSVSDPELLDYIIESFEDTGVSPEHVCFEITETAAIANLTSARYLITALKDMGCRFALDDFGSGLSSFGYLRSLPVTFVKIDGAFVRDMDSDEADLAMVKSINQVAHALGIKTVAEYVESQEVYDLVTAIGIDFAQGVHIAKPVEVSPGRLGLSCLLPLRGASASV
jgi:diguanylate cyclase (GGDEF)-like protein/PAS domain S-box-containing protein